MTLNIFFLEHGLQSEVGYCAQMNMFKHKEVQTQDTPTKTKG